MSDKLSRMINGSREIVGDAWLDSVAMTDYGSEIKTCINRQACGVLDRYVAWIRESAAPPDLERRGWHAYGSK